MNEARALILVQAAGLRDELENVASRLPWASALGLSFVHVDGDPHHVVAERRTQEGGIPIGFVGDTEASVLAALTGGADEADVLTNADAASLTRFAHRMEARALLRAERWRLHTAFAHAEKLTALGTLVAGIGHEINNPLAVVLLSIDAVRRWVLPAHDAAYEVARLVRDGAVHEDALARFDRIDAAGDGGRETARIFDDMAAGVDAITSIVRDLRVFARNKDNETPEVLAIEDVVDQALRLMSRELFQYALVERDHAADVPKLLVPRNRVAQVIINLLVNAAHAMREIERPAHRLRISTRADDEFVALVISDTGPGISAESIERIFDPYFTTKRQELGTGLGLSISRAILRDMGGDLWVESVFGEGATFICFLPIPTEAAVRAAYEQRSEKMHRPTTPSVAVRSVLLVDDDERVLRSYTRVLHPHRVLIAQDGGDAIELLQSGSAPDAVVLELALPRVDGRKLLGWLAENRPQLYRRTLVVTSAGSREEYGEFLRTHQGPVLHKPVHGATLLAEVARLLS